MGGSRSGRIWGSGKFFLCGFTIRLEVGFICGQTPVRVASGVDFGEGLDVDAGVDLSGFHAFVTEHFLHESDVRTILLQTPSCPLVESPGRLRPAS
jgi:hypothetical protein